jgi:hypothetical protein
MNDYLPSQRQLAFHAVIVLTVGMISVFIGFYARCYRDMFCTGCDGVLSAQ